MSDPAARDDEAENFLRVMDAHTIVSMGDGDGVITYANDHFCAITGYRREELLGRNHSIVRSDRHDDAFFDEMWSTILRGDIWQGILCNRDKGGREYWVRSTIAPSRFENSPHRFISICTDVTDIVTDRERLAALSSELALFKKIIENTTEAVSVVDAEGRFVYSNPARDILTRSSPGEAIGRRFSEMIPESAAALTAAIGKGIAEGTGWRGQLPIRRADGTTFISASNIGVLSDAEGRVQFAFDVFHDFTLELARRMELDNARRAADSANRAKSEFLSGMSHELRTPLNVILGFSEVLLSMTVNPLDDKQRAYVEHILTGGRHLLTLIDGVLDLAKIEAGGMTIAVEPLVLRSVIDECLSLSGPMFTRYGVTLVDEVVDCRQTVLADPLRAKQLLLNLLSNASKYNRRGGTIRLSCADIGGEYHRIVVADTGMGIPDDKLEQLFKPFSRLGAEATEIEGTGIGLALSKTLIEAMGGNIGVSSVVGEGSRFWLDFPLGDQEAVPTVAASAGAADQPLLHYCVEDRLVLYVEDSKGNRHLMEALFETLAPLRLMTASSATAGIALAESAQPDIIVLDINLPDMNGIEAMAYLRGNTKTAHIPVLALSADGTGATKARAMRAGFADYVAKPVQLPVLLRTIGRVMESNDATQP